MVLFSCTVYIIQRVQNSVKEVLSKKSCIRKVWRVRGGILSQLFFLVLRVELLSRCFPQEPTTIFWLAAS